MCCSLSLQSIFILSLLFPTKKKTHGDVSLFFQEDRAKQSIGARVEVADKGAGVLSFFGFVHFLKNTKVCGVTLDEPNVS